MIEHLLQRRDALRRLALLVQAEHGVEHRQADDHDARRELLQRDDADDRGAEQDELHQVAVLAQERSPAGLLLRLRELVRADLRAAPLDLGGVEPERDLDPESLTRLFRREAVPRDCLVSRVIRPDRRFYCRGDFHQSLSTLSGKRLTNGKYGTDTGFEVDVWDSEESTR